MTAAPSTLPTGRRGQVFAVGLLGLALATVWLAVASPALDWYADRAQLLQQRRALAARMAAVAASVPALQAERASLGDVRPALLDAASPAIAGALLQQRLQDMSERTGVRLTSVEVLPAEQASSRGRVRVHVTVTGTWPRLVRLLSDVEQAAPSMVVEELQVGLSRTITTESAKPLDASFTVVGFHAAPDARQ